METREYFEKVMLDYNQNRNGRSLRKYCKDEAIDYNWLLDFKKTYSASKPLNQHPQSFVALSLEEEKPKEAKWEVACLQLQSPDGDSIEIKSNNLFAVSELLRKLVRACCYFHGRHYWCDAYVSDVRALPVINLINSLFLVDKQAKDENMDSWQRLMLRLKYSEPIVRKLFKLLHQMKANIDDYGSLMKRAINYMLDDEKGFKAFLTDGAIELSNNAAERMFRHIAMGRRRSTLSLGLSKNWLHIGSHMAAQDVAFMYSLYEICRLNNINFGKYLNDILTRMMKGDTNYMTMLPCNYVAQEHEDELKVKECA